MQDYIALTISRIHSGSYFIGTVAVLVWNA